MKILKFLLPLLFVVIHAGAQKPSGQKISGRVISASEHAGIGGVLVSFKKQPIKVVTDSEGSFSILTSGAPDSLVFSHISYQRKALSTRKATAAPLEIVLNELIKNLDQVVVNTGFQQIPKERSTGSFSFVDNKTLNLQVGTSILSRLNGLSNAILFDNTKNPTSNRKLNINIRGLSTINGSQDPLIILDNFPYEGDLNTINPSDVESITILKDAAAASIWGTKAGNGVIVITTKKAHFNQPLKVDFNSNVMIAEKPDLFSVPQMDVGDYIDVEQTLFNKGFFNSQIYSNSMPALSPAVEVFLKRQNGLISAADSASAINELKNNDVRRDLSKYMYRSAVTQTYSLHLSGGSDKYKYIFSLGYDHDLGNLQDINDRLNIGMKNTFKVSDKLQVSVGTSFTNANSKSGFAPFSTIKGFYIGGRYIPYIKLAGEDGTPLPVAQTYRESYIDTAGGGKLLDWKYYPLEDDWHHITKTNTRTLIASIGLKYQILKSLSLDISYQYQDQEVKSRNLSDMESFQTRNLINTFTQIDPATGAVDHIMPMGGILYTTDHAMEAHNARGQLNFGKPWHNNNITAILGSEIRQTRNKGGSNMLYGYNDDLLTFGDVDFVNPYPTYITGYSQYIGNNFSLSESLNRFISFFGNAAYTYKDRYTLSASARKDASNLFGLKTNDKWSPFWSTGIGWNLSKENFYHSNFLPYLKFRATYGYSGIVDQSKSAVTVMEYAGNNKYMGTPFGIITQFANDELRWEKVGQLNLGVDFASKKGVLKGSLEYYIKKGIDLFGVSPIDYTAGLSTSVLTKNIANMRGNGIDLSLQTLNINQSFQWTTNWLFSYNTSITTRYYAEPGIRYGEKSGDVISPLVGKSLYSVMSYQWGGLDQMGNPQGYYNKQLSTDYLSILYSITNPDSLVYDGPGIPTFFGALRNTFSWKGFSLDVNITYKLGYLFRKSSISYDQLVNTGIGNKDYSNRWQKPGDELVTSIPAFIYPINSDARDRDQFYGGSETTVLNAGQIRLQFINLSYDFDRKLFKKSPLGMLQLYFNASNLGLLWKANDKGIDPDFQNSWPTPTTYAFGIRANF